MERWGGDAGQQFERQRMCDSKQARKQELLLMHVMCHHRSIGRSPR